MLRSTIGNKWHTDVLVRLAGFSLTMFRKVSPLERLSQADYVLASALLAALFALFFHPDIELIGWASLNYLFSNPLDFYDNSKKLLYGGTLLHATAYPPPIYLIFAAWMLPLKLFGLISDAQVFPGYLVYWLKVLTTIVYALSGILFQRIAAAFHNDAGWTKYAATIWITTPIALFSQFIFSQIDIFYVTLSLWGFLAFIRRKILLAATLFGFAITFKYFPLFAFAPLLLLYEKRTSRIVLAGAIFAAPTLLIQLVYGDSPAFIQDIRNYDLLDRIYIAALDTGVWKIYLLFVTFCIVSGAAYFTDTDEDRSSRVAAYYWMAGSIIPFLFIFWHPQWMMAVTPPIVLTSLIARNGNRFLLLDLAGMACFIGATVITFQGNVDLAMFHGSYFGVNPDRSWTMAHVFNLFGGNSAHVWISCFWAYLIMQVIAKGSLLRGAYTFPPPYPIEYDRVRTRFLAGLMIFVVPALWSLYQSATARDVTLNDSVFVDMGIRGEALNDRILEQSFTAIGPAISKFSVLATHKGMWRSTQPPSVTLEITSADGNKVLATARTPLAQIVRNDWTDFPLSPPITVTPNQKYVIRMKASDETTGRVTFWRPMIGDYPGGEARVNGQVSPTDFGFRVAFPK